MFDGVEKRQRNIQSKLHAHVVCNFDRSVVEVACVVAFIDNALAVRRDNNPGITPRLKLIQFNYRNLCE